MFAVSSLATHVPSGLPRCATTLRFMPVERQVTNTTQVRCFSRHDLVGPGNHCLIHRGDDPENHRISQSELALFGFIPSWACDARSATQNCIVHVSSIANKPAFRSALHQVQFCWLAVEYFLGNIWKNGREHLVRIERADNNPLHLAGIWSEWMLDNGTRVLSFGLLTRDTDEQLQAHGFRLGQGSPQCYAVLTSSEKIDWTRLPFEETLRALAQTDLPQLRVIPHAVTDRPLYVT